MCLDRPLSAWFQVEHALCVISCLLSSCQNESLARGTGMWWHKVTWLIIHLSVFRWRRKLRVCCRGVRESEGDSCSRRQIFQKRALGPLRHACQSGAVLTCAVESGTIMAPGAHSSSALASTSYSRSIIRNNTLNSLSQSERFMSCSNSDILAAATLTRFSPSGCDGVSPCQPKKRLTQTHNSSMSDIYSPSPFEGLKGLFNISLCIAPGSWR